MQILIAGSKGQVGRNLITHLANKYDVIGIDLPELDIGDSDNVQRHLREHLPDIVINAAAFTNVDACVNDFPTAYRVNALGAQNLALACAEFNIDFLHISSNEVFPGQKPEGYLEDDEVDPINPYAVTKEAAEAFVRQVHDKHYIVRFSWLFAPGGNNFIHKVLQRANEGQPLRIVTDEVASPTYVKDLVIAIEQLIGTRHYGTYHLSNSGICSRYDFARTALNEAGFGGTSIEKISSSEFTRASTPPPYCGLQNHAAAAMGITLRPWQDAVKEYVQEYGRISAERS